MSSSWRMACPKCSSLNIDLEEDQRAFLGGGRHQVQLHCYTCGKIIYGEKPIADEAERQRALWEKTQAEREAKDAEDARKKAEAPQRRPLPEDPRRRLVDPRRRNVEPVKRRGVDEERLARVGAGRKVEPAAAPPPAPPVVEPVAAPVVAVPIAVEPVAEAPVEVTEAAAPIEPEAPSSPPADEPAEAAAPAIVPLPGISLERVADDGSLEAFDEETNRRVALGLCAWSDCEKHARPNSKYCSRNCSNKNARARHSRRRKTEGDDVPAEAPAE